MRKLTIRPRMGDASIKLIEDVIGEKFDIYFAEFLKKNAGLSHEEFIYIDKSKTEWHVQSYNDFNDLFGLTKEFLDGYKRKLVPFAYDGGGWHFCLSFDDETYGKIIINRWTDHLPEEQFLVIADNFEEFINGLKTEENV
jgi:hypothetical protein